MTTKTWDGHGRAPAILLGGVLMVAMVSCGKSGLDGGHPDAAIGASGGTDQGGATSSTGGAGQGGATSSTGGAGQGGSVVSSTPQGSGGSAGGKSGSTLVPHVPAGHRPSAPSCSFVRTAEPVDPPAGTCTKHADCVARPNGECVNTSLGSPGRPMPASFNCVYDLCAKDDDCADNEVCDCTSGGIGTCISRVNCRLDSDCGGGPTSYCSRAYEWDCGSYRALGSYRCHTPQDTCLDDSDCTGQDFCDYDVIDGRWECRTPNLNCAIG